MEDTNNLILSGDIHGEFRSLVWTVTTRYGIKDCDLIVLGDFGVGFDKSLEPEYRRIENRLSKAGVRIWALRGNHDDPDYFKDENSFEWLRFLEDHKTYTIAGRECYIIGGAHSVDIKYRLEENEKLKKKKRAIWWEGEPVVQKMTDLPLKVDLILSHTAPISFEPVVAREGDLPEYQYRNIINEREYLQHVLEEVNADYWFYGHFHNHYSGSFGKLLYRGLGIMELYQVPDKEKDI